MDDFNPVSFQANLDQFKAIARDVAPVMGLYKRLLDKEIGDATLVSVLITDFHGQFWSFMFRPQEK